MNPLASASLRMRRLFALLAALAGAAPVPAVIRADVVVAADGSGQYTSVQEAISAAPMRTAASDPRWVILVKAGTYTERIYVQRERGNIALVGEDADRTIITYGLFANVSGPDGKPIGTFRTPTMQIDGDGFVAENLTFANSAGPVGQALALRVDGDRVAFRHCRFLGWQDTILVNRGRQYFADCSIEGHVDFIFGAATAYFDHCSILCKGEGYVTAASTPQGAAYGFVFADCRITGAPGVSAYLGRPWRNFARTVFLRTEMDKVIRREGWHNWSKPAAEGTSFYAEYASTGPGAVPAARAPWSHQLSANEAAGYNVEHVLGGADHWNPLSGFAVTQSAAPWQPDLGDGRYRNPVLYADYSDPDAVRVGDDYWLTASSFGHVPGLPLLHSRDLVNWELAGHALPRLMPAATFAQPQPGKGVWAPAIRHHDGRYWIYYPDPDQGIFVTTSIDPRGPWSAPVLVQDGKGLIDPCPLWDEDGRVWLIHAWAKSRSGINNRLTLLRLSADGTRVEENLGVVIDGDKLPGYSTLEGPKLYRRNGWYYVFAPAGGVPNGWQAVFRAHDIRGPYAERRVLAQGATAINGPHQGALVDTPAGDWWFLHFQDQGAYGRVVHLQPVVWHDDWPVIGADPRGTGCGEPLTVGAKPALPAASRQTPPVNDEFDGPALGLQWQWQCNPAPEWASLAARPGWLRLRAEPLPGAGLVTAGHLLLQKFAAPQFTATTELDGRGLAPGDTAGLIVFGHTTAYVGVQRTASGWQAVWQGGDEAAPVAPAAVPGALPTDGRIWLRLEVVAGARCRFSCSADGEHFTAVGSEFTAQPGRWVGAKVGLFALSAGPAAGGQADFAWFHASSPPSAP